MNSGLVSIIAPCYDVERFIVRFIDSLVDQTYKRLEIILVNDGSTDRTGEMIRKSLSCLELEGYIVKVVEQANRGLAGAIDTGLKHFTGEFVTWPDPDDWLTPDSITRRVELMRRFPDAGLLRTACRLYLDERGEFGGDLGRVGGDPVVLGDLFSRLFLGRTHYHPVCYFARSSAFLATTGRSIHVAEGGNSQNLQMLLPLTERFPTVEAGEICANYTMRADSRSRRDVTPAPKVRRITMLVDNLMQTIPKLAGDQVEYRKIAEQAWLRNRLLIAAFEGNLVSVGESALGRSGLSAVRRSLARTLLHGKARLFPSSNHLTPEGGSAPYATRAFRKVVHFDPDSVSLPLPSTRVGI
jgi:glycosyltransferase involved in cell wall biosynthesis